MFSRTAVSAVILALKGHNNKHRPSFPSWHEPFACMAVCTSMAACTSTPLDAVRDASQTALSLNSFNLAIVFYYKELDWHYI